MCDLPEGLRREFEAVFGRRAPVTSLELVLKGSAWMSDAGKGKLLDQFKQRVFEMRANRFVSVDAFEFESISTSLDGVFGGPLVRGEVVSVEGATGCGKTRLALKVAHDVAACGKVLYIDADFALQESIVYAVRESLGVREPRVGFSIDSDAPLVVAVVESVLELYSTINKFCETESPDLIVIDSLASLFQGAVMVDGPGSAMLQELALELKALARSKKCSIIVTNGLRSDTNPPQPFLGRLYASLWHSRLHLTPASLDLIRCDLVASPRSPPTSRKLVAESLELCE